jgi:uncharacterized membrane protein YciS (DUF1049 family)
MRWVCLLFLLAVTAAAVIFFRENDQAQVISFLGWSITAPVAAVVGISYGLGMLTGWSLLGLLRRSFDAATDFRRREPVLR